MKTVQMAVEPNTKKPRLLTVELGNLTASASVELLTAVGGDSIIKGSATNIQAGVHFGERGTEESDKVKDARLKLIDAVEIAVADFYMATND